LVGQPREEAFRGADKRKKKGKSKDKKEKTGHSVYAEKPEKGGPKKTIE